MYDIQRDTTCPRRLAALVCCLLTALLAGCETDAWLHDPSVVGYWERTPTRVPILERISAIEGPEDQFVQISEIQPEDLVPIAEPYRVGSGDVIDIQVWDIAQVGTPSLFQAIVDAQGFIDLPQLGSIYVHGMTTDEIRQAVIAAAERFVADPIVTVTVSGRRDQTYAVLGQVGAPGTYLVPEPDYRLLEAITTAGGIPETLPHIYIIRQVALTDRVRGVNPDAPPPGARNPDEVPEDQEPPDPDDLIDIIDELSNPDDGGGAPGVYGSIEWQPAQDQPPAGEQSSGEEQPDEPEAEEGPPPIDLIEEAPPEDTQPGEEARQAGTWLFLNGEWVRVRDVSPMRDDGAPPDGEPLLAAEQLVTQRVIEVPVDRLLSGDARYNPVVRPGDVIRVPAPPQGPIYMAGFVNRPGAYTLPSIGRITLTQAIASAGGLQAVAMPERVDLTRRVSPTHQATIRLNLRAIYEHTQPDVFLKSQDMINVGTSFWAFPWAVVRNGFRATYGFGFLLDRNFGNDVFGPPPVNRGF